MIASFSTLRQTNFLRATRGKLVRHRVGAEPKVLAELPVPGACRSISWGKGVKEITYKVAVQMYATGDVLWLLELDAARRVVSEWVQMDDVDGG